MDETLGNTGDGLEKSIGGGVPSEPGECHIAYGRLRQRPYGIPRTLHHPIED